MTIHTGKEITYAKRWKALEWAGQPGIIALKRTVNLLFSSQPDPQDPQGELVEIGMILRTLIISYDSGMIRDRKTENGGVFRKCLVGCEMTDWLISVSTVTPVRVHSRAQAVAMWQVLMEEDVLISPSIERHFQDKYCFYRFCFEEESGPEMANVPSDEERTGAESALVHCLTVLNQLAPEANFRYVLSKPGAQRTPEEVDGVYEELKHIKALSHLGDSVRKDLAQVIAFEKYQRKGTVCKCLSLLFQILFTNLGPTWSWIMNSRHKLHEYICICLTVSSQCKFFASLLLLSCHEIILLAWQTTLDSVGILVLSAK